MKVDDNMGNKGQEIVDLNVAELVADLRRAYADEWPVGQAFAGPAQGTSGAGPVTRELVHMS